MRTKCSKHPLPRCFATHPKAKGIIAETGIGFTGKRLYAKVLVFDNRTNLRRFWKKCLGKSDLGPKCLGAVSSLQQHVTKFEKGKKDKVWRQVDRRYFCVIGLLKKHLTMEIICHESVHAAFAFASRIKRTPWEAMKEHFHEEELAYPAGEIAAAINRFLYDRGFYNRK